ncbi:MAG: HNH endonuclease [Desulfobacterales bacterium]|nr:HNH endonuclease [Desulfobacterales bacterium]
MRKSGYCNTHHYRFEKGLPLDSPIMKGVKGEKHWNWRGGASEYKNMYEMKKIRKIVLEEENYTCHYCGCYTDEVHHKDLSKDNHVRENLTACCRSCNLKRAKKHRSHKEAYNITISTHKKRLAF